ncbi:MAG: glutamate racemase [Candidatus Kapaibacteriales bacterium]
MKNDSSKKSTQNAPIGIFDSGVGGLSVYQELKRLLPSQSFIYLGDTARVPYGNKSEKLIQRYSAQCTDFLLQKGVKTIVIACNTASSFAFKTVEGQCGNIPVVEMIGPASIAATKSTKTGKIVILGTKGTVNNGSYKTYIENLSLKFQKELEVTQIACPLFVPFIEEGFKDHNSLVQIASEYLNGISYEVDTVILGCTHYPFIHTLLQKVLGQNKTLVSSALPAAKIVAEMNLDSNPDLDFNNNDQFFVTDDPSSFIKTAQLLGVQINSASKAIIE